MLIEFCHRNHAEQKVNHQITSEANRFLDGQEILSLSRNRKVRYRVHNISLQHALKQSLIV
jgi:hypothetical protein